jgi:hypothetical protein
MKLLKDTIYTTVLLSCFVLCMSCSNYAAISPRWEIPDPDLKEIAMIRADPHWGAAVIYNPETCKEIGEACGFFRLHAFAHRHLNHLLLAEPAAYPASQENQADCWAAMYGKTNDVQAAVRLFLDEDRNPAWRIHGNPLERAKNIRTCAIQAGKWSDEMP